MSLVDEVDDRFQGLTEEQRVLYAKQKEFLLNNPEGSIKSYESYMKSFASENMVQSQIQ